MRVKTIITQRFLWAYFILVIWLLASGVQAQYGGGTGEQNNPYLIYTAEQMNAIGAEPNDWGKHFKLMTDINLIDYKGTDFNIIGNGLQPFNGVFDGNGHTISNFTYTYEDIRYSFGMFGYIEDANACISNLGLIDPNVYVETGRTVSSLVGWLSGGTIYNCYAVNCNISGEDSIGGLVGRSSGIIIDCNATGNVEGLSHIGGLVGDNDRAGYITKSHSAGNVTGDLVAGGLVGSNDNDAMITHCSSTANVVGSQIIGGLVGGNGGNVANSYSQGNIEGEDYIGGLVGSNGGVVIASYASANIQGQNDVGGLVGHNSPYAEILDCYANGNVIGQSYVGGLLGNNPLSPMGRDGSQYYGTVQSCYSTVVVSGNQNIGGFVGSDDGGGVSSDCFWDIESSGQATSAGGIGKTTAEMQNPNTFIDAGWDFLDASDGPSDIWAEPDEGGYPVLLWQLSPVPELPTFSGGTGEPNDPYLISTADELNSIGHNPRLMTAHFKLINDIDLAGMDFFIIANRWNPFSGTFDGDWHVISNLSYTSSEDTFAGLISYAIGARIKNLGLINPNINVVIEDRVGSLVGYLNRGTITNCYVESGSVSGNDYIGGLVGDNDSESIIMGCYTTGSVRGNDSVGGLVGTNSGTIINCYSHCSATGSDYIGGLVGSNYRSGEIYNCYATGDAHAKRYVSGLLARNFRGSVIQSFWDAQTSGWPTSVAGGTGLTTAEMQTAGTFIEAGWDFVGETDNGTEDIWWILEGQDYPRLYWEEVSGG